MVLSCQNIHKTFVDQEVLKGISFHINEKDRLAVIGLNGAGKSTLLKIIMDQMTPDDGDIRQKEGRRYRLSRTASGPYFFPHHL